MPRKSPDLQSVSDALNTERAWTCTGRAAPGSRPDSQGEGGDPAVPGDSEPTLGARPGLGLRTPGPVRGPGGSGVGSRPTPGPGLHPQGQAALRRLHVQPRGPMTSSPSRCELLAPLLGRLPGPGAQGISGASLKPLLWPGGLSGPPAPPPARVLAESTPGCPLPPAGRSSQADLQPRNSLAPASGTAGPI